MAPSIKLKNFCKLQGKKLAISKGKSIENLLCVWRAENLTTDRWEGRCFQTQGATQFLPPISPSATEHLQYSHLPPLASSWSPEAGTAPAIVSSSVHKVKYNDCIYSNREKQQEFRGITLLLNYTAVDSGSPFIL